MKRLDFGENPSDNSHVVTSHIFLCFFAISRKLFIIETSDFHFGNPRQNLHMMSCFQFLAVIILFSLWRHEHCDIYIIKKYFYNSKYSDLQFLQSLERSIRSTFVRYLDDISKIYDVTDVQISNFYPNQTTYQMFRLWWKSTCLL